MKQLSKDELVNKAMTDAIEMATEFLEEFLEKVENAKSEEEAQFFLLKVLFFVTVLMKHLAFIDSEKVLAVCQKSCEMIKLGQSKGVF